MESYLRSGDTPKLIVVQGVEHVEAGHARCMRIVL
jgi:hypothetical protein